MLLSMHATAQLHADFSSNIKQGCAPLVVYFLDLSTGNPTQWLWDLGNGVTSTEQDASTIFINPGIYTIKLIIKNAAGTDSVIKTNNISVFENPVAAFSAIPLQGCTPLNVNFADSSSTATGTITQWIWDFGDGVTSTQKNPSHSYTISDTFDVSLSVFNNYGCKQTLQQPSLIKVNLSPESIFSYTYDDACKAPANLNFNNASTSDKPLVYQWSFGDGATSNQQNPQHTYAASGNYNVSLSAVSTNGCTNTSKQVISIGAAKADFAYTSACLNEPVVFIDKSIPTPLSEVWDFGDGTKDSGITVTHVYATDGAYQVTLLTNFGECTDVVKKTINSGKKPHADFTASGRTKTCIFPTTIQFTNTSNSAKNFKWVFSDGSTTEEMNPVRTYNQPGKYTVALIAFNENGCADTITKDNFIEIGPPEILSIEGAPFEGCAPTSVTFKPVIGNGSKVNSYAWDFGDGNFSGDSTPTHVYKNTGIYDVSLIVSTSEGCGDTLIFPSAVLLGKKPKANFTATPLDVCAETPVQFADVSTGFVTNREWNFGDGGSSNEIAPSHRYEDTGHFTVQLIVQQYGCSDTLTKQDYVYVKPPVAKFSAFAKCSDPSVYTFTDKSIGAKKWQWNFGDGTIIPTTDDSNQTHVYAATGIYYTSLLVMNGECSYKVFDTLQIIEENPSFAYKFLSPNSCEHDSIQFSATNYAAGNIQSFRWDFGDGVTSSFSSDGNTTYHVYQQSGSFTPLLIVKDLNNCVDTINNNVPVKVLGPTAAFASEGGDCVHSLINFKDESLTNGSQIKTWIWDYGDGTVTDTLTASPFKHKYDTSGTFTVLLKVIDANNCYDTTSNLPISITSPVVNFYTDDTLSCAASAVQFIDSSIAVSPTYNWNFGDGKSSSGPQPEHNYTLDGTYNVKLVLTDKYGCTDSVTKTQYIRIANPVAGYKLSDTLFLCPPGKIDPVIEAGNYTSVLWNFGDGNTSSEITPEHYYTQAGVYNVSLVVNGYGNCSDTFAKPVTLKGPSATFSYSPLTNCSPLNVAFLAQSKNTIKYVWDFGNGVLVDTTSSLINYTYLKPGKFLPQLVVIDSGGCAVPVVNTDTIVVTGAAASYIAAQVQGICDSSLFNFSNNSEVLYDSITSYKWNFGDGDSSSAINPKHYYNKPGFNTTSLKILTAGGCESHYELPLSVAIDSMPVVLITAADTACVNENVLLTASVQNNSALNFSWQWNFGDGTSADKADTNYTYSSAGNYNLFVTAAGTSGCIDTVKHSIYINPAPTIDAGIDSTICKGNSTTLIAKGGTTYTWLNNSSLSCLTCNNPVVSPQSTSTYYVTGSNKFNCTASDSVIVQVKQPFNINISAPDTICNGTTIQLKATGAELYTWTPATQVTSSTDSTTSATPSLTTIYTVIGTDSKNCFHDTASAKVHVFPVPAIQLTDSVVQIQAGETYQVNLHGSEDIASWSWNPAVTVSCGTCPNPVITPQQSATYTVTAKNFGGCSAEKHIIFNVWCKGDNIFIPNTFSPNADGMNDYFYPRGKGLSNIKSFRIFNRWGTVVFSNSNFPPNQQSYGWNGTYNGKALQADVYVFIADIICENNQVISIKGNVTLLR